MPARKLTSSAIASLAGAVFLFGLLSAPLRTCLNHQHHGHGGAASASSHRHGTVAGAHEGHAPSGADSAPEGEGRLGCECLGQCCIESPSMGASTAGLAVIATPAPTADEAAVGNEAPQPRYAYPTHLARPPPTLV